MINLFHGRGDRFPKVRQLQRLLERRMEDREALA
jgi:hypothetical protein